ncbi:hypothetical protein [Guptibacillus spartinae]|uniref:hypothetical protein n=1 Tax=Guptibacillus spartinae TaxID=3025679 RepID=UPI00235E5AE1|nr:hypothetical protein [Pseudalkalibacillus spartinae]
MKIFEMRGIRVEKKEAIKNVKQFIKDRQYTYKVHDIVESYQEYYKKGWYISYTMKDCIKHLKEELEVLTAA